MQIRVKSVSVLLVLLRKNLTLIRFGQKIVLVLIWCTSGLHGSYGQFGAFVFKSVPKRKSCLTFSVRQLWMFISSCQFWILTCANKTCKTPTNSHVNNHASPFLMRCLLLPFFGSNRVYIYGNRGWVSLCMEEGVRVLLVHLDRIAVLDSVLSYSFLFCIDSVSWLGLEINELMSWCWSRLAPSTR